MGVIRKNYGEWNNAPLVYTLFMLRFPKQMKLSSEEEARSVIVELEAKLKDDFPIYEQQLDQGIEFSQDSKSQNFSTFIEPEYHFISPDRCTGVVVKTDRLIVHTTNYENFPSFETCLKCVIAIVTESLDITVFNSFGLRYVDAIDSIKEGNPVQAISQSLHPFQLGIDNVNHTTSQYVNLYDTPFGRLIFKSFYTANGKANTVIPPDLTGLARRLKQSRKMSEGPSILLDYDHNYTVDGNAVEKLDLENLFTNLGEMHNISSNAFIKTINADLTGNWE